LNTPYGPLPSKGKVWSVLNDYQKLGVPAVIFIKVKVIKYFKRIEVH